MERRFLAGIVLLTIGIVLLFRYFGFFPLGLPWYLFTWKTLLIVLGVIFLFTERRSTTGLILIVIGSVFFSADFFNVSISQVISIGIPVALILAGLLLILRRQTYSRKDINMPDEGQTNDVINDMSIFGGGEKKITSQNFRGGRLTAIFGGSELDLRTAELAQGVNAVDIMCLFGGFTLRVPEDWEVINEVSAVFGGFSDKRMLDKKIPRPITSSKILYIKGIVVFGGGEIK
jgi:predicted membrane protein